MQTHLTAIQTAPIINDKAKNQRDLSIMPILKFFILSLITILVGFSLLSMNLINASEDIANLAIETAESAVISAFEAVSEAEQIGGNVTGLLANLNEAGEFLAVAQMSYRNEDFDNAVYFANLSRDIGEEVKSEAYALQISAWNESTQRMLFTGIGSFSGMIFVILGSLWFWRFFKRWHFRRVLKMKPEVAKGES